MASVRGVAQPGSAHVWGACGRRFKSSRPDHPPTLKLRRDGTSQARRFSEADAAP